MPRIDTTGLKLEERVVRVNRVSKVVKGGRRFSFSAVVVVGDGNGHVGIGMGKAGEVPEAIRKGVEQAKKELIAVPLSGTTIPHRVDTNFGATKIMLKPASAGTGVIAGGAVRAVVEAAGIRDILSKNYGSNNSINVVKAAMKALQELQSPADQAIRRGLPPDRFQRAPQIVEVSSNGTEPEPEAAEAEASVAAAAEGPETEASEPVTQEAPGTPAVQDEEVNAPTA